MGKYCGVLEGYKSYHPPKAHSNSYLNYILDGATIHIIVPDNKRYLVHHPRFQRHLNQQCISNVFGIEVGCMKSHGSNSNHLPFHCQCPEKEEYVYLENTFKGDIHKS